MGLTRKFLKELGLESEQIEKIIGEHTDVITAIKEDLDTANSKVKDLEKSKKEEIDLTNYVEKSKYETLETQYNDFKTETANKETLAKKQEVVKEKILKELKLSDKVHSKVLKDIDFATIELDEKGNIKDIETLTNSIKNDWGDFVVTEEKQGSNVATPPNTENKEADPFLDGLGI